MHTCCGRIHRSGLAFDFRLRGFNWPLHRREGRCVLEHFGLASILNGCEFAGFPQNNYLRVVESGGRRAESVRIGDGGARGSDGYGQVGIALTGGLLHQFDRDFAVNGLMPIEEWCVRFFFCPGKVGFHVFLCGKKSDAFTLHDGIENS